MGTTRTMENRRPVFEIPVWRSSEQSQKQDMAVSMPAQEQDIANPIPEQEQDAVTSNLAQEQDSAAPTLAQEQGAVEQRFTEEQKSHRCCPAWYIGRDRQFLFRKRLS